MTEERMIRFSVSENDMVNGTIWVEDKWGHRMDIDIEPELAPPKDWTPRCHCPRCNEVDDTWDEQCQLCIFAIWKPLEEPK